MKNLREMAIAATKENIVKRGQKENVLESMMRHLYEEKAEYSRTDLIGIISLDRMVWEHGQETVEKWAEEKVAGKTTTFDDKMEEYNKTVKNGIDTAVSNSKNNSAFSYNEKYSDYEMIRFNKNGEEWIKIVDRDKAGKSKK